MKLRRYFIQKIVRNNFKKILFLHYSRAVAEVSIRRNTSITSSRRAMLPKYEHAPSYDLVMASKLQQQAAQQAAAQQAVVVHRNSQINDTIQHDEHMNRVNNMINIRNAGVYKYVIKANTFCFEDRFFLHKKLILCLILFLRVTQWWIWNLS